jgi:hypothetical protein
MSKQPLLQWWRDLVGLWTVPLVDEAVVREGWAINEVAMNVYELPSTKNIVQFLHAALRFPMKATLLLTSKMGTLSPFLNSTENVSYFFPESNETKKGHMKQPNQGVRSMNAIDEDAILKAEIKQTPNPGVKHKDVYVCRFDATKKSTCMDQTGRFPSHLPKDINI